MAAATIEFSLNGATRSAEADPTAPLLDVLRNQLGVTGARFGCGAGDCFACAVLVDGEVKASCQIEAGNAAGKTIVTVEGIGTPEAPHPLQSAFIEKQAGQCGYCLAGLIVGAKALLDANPNPSRAEIATALSPHLCRCGTHNRIMDAVALAATRMSGAAA